MVIIFFGVIKIVWCCLHELCILYGSTEYFTDLSRWKMGAETFQLTYFLDQMIKPWNFTLAKTTKSTQVHVGVVSKVLNDVNMWRC